MAGKTLTSDKNEWERFATPLRQEYGDDRVNEALNRLEHDDVFEWEGRIGVRLRRELGDDRSQSGARAYWPKRDAESGRLRCMCHEMKQAGVCSHALAAHMYRQWMGKLGAFDV